MTEEERIEGILALGVRVRGRLKALIEEDDALPEVEGPVGNALITWRVCLMTLSWDVSDGALSILATENGSCRAVAVLVRSLFEYALHLEYYA